MDCLKVLLGHYLIALIALWLFDLVNEI